MQGASFLLQRFPLPVQIGLIIFLGKGTRLAIVPAMHTTAGFHQGEREDGGARSQYN